MKTATKAISKPILKPEGRTWLKKAAKWLKGNAYKFFIGATILAFNYLMIIVASIERGYKAYGGEYLIIPTAVLIYMAYRQAKKEKDEDE